MEITGRELLEKLDHQKLRDAIREMVNICAPVASSMRDMKVNVVPRISFDERANYLATDGEQIYATPHAISKFSQHKIAMILIHELIHVLNLHPMRMKLLYKGDKPTRDEKLTANIAADIIVNEWIDENIKKIKENPEFEGLVFDRDGEFHNLSLEEIYLKLQDDAQEQAQQQGDEQEDKSDEEKEGEDNQNQQGSDDESEPEEPGEPQQGEQEEQQENASESHQDSGEAGQETADSDAPSDSQPSQDPSDAAREESETSSGKSSQSEGPQDEAEAPVDRQDAAPQVGNSPKWTHYESYGSILPQNNIKPEEITKMVRENKILLQQMMLAQKMVGSESQIDFTEGAFIDWKTELQNFACKCASEEGEDFNWQRRDTLYIPMGTILPSRVEELTTKTLAIVFDISSSVTREMLKTFIQELNGIRKSLNNLAVRVITINTRIVEDVTFNETEEVPTDGWKVGGGTALRPAFDKINQDILDKQAECDGVVCFTDMYNSSWPDKQSTPYDILWLNYGSRDTVLDPDVPGRVVFMG